MIGPKPSQDLPPLNPVRAGDIRVWILTFSLLLNLALGISLVLPAPNPARHQAQSTSSARGLKRLARVGTPATNDAASATSSELPFHWSQIESSDYRQYIANLRALGCPEQTLRDIVLADLNQMAAEKRRTVWMPATVAYWQKDRNKEPSRAQMKQLDALEKEHAQVVKELLGIPWNYQAAMDTVLMQVYGADQELLFLPDDKRTAALDIFNQTAADKGDPGPTKDLERLSFKEKMYLLAQVLTPEELEEYRLRNSPGARNLRQELQYFDCTPEEFKQLLAVREQKGAENPYPDLLKRVAATEQVRQLFGDERAAQFERETDLFYINTRQALDSAGLPVELADQAWQICRDVRVSADQAAKDSSLSVEERRQEIKDLETEAEAQLVQVLGQRASRPACINLRPMLTVTAQNVKP